MLQRDTAWQIRKLLPSSTHLVLSSAIPILRPFSPSPKGALDDPDSRLCQSPLNILDCTPEISLLQHTDPVLGVPSSSRLCGDTFTQPMWACLFGPRETVCPIERHTQLVARPGKFRGHRSECTLQERAFISLGISGTEWYKSRSRCVFITSRLLSSVSRNYSCAWTEKPFGRRYCGSMPGSSVH